MHFTLLVRENLIDLELKVPHEHTGVGKHFGIFSRLFALDLQFVLINSHFEYQTKTILAGYT